MYVKDERLVFLFHCSFPMAYLLLITQVWLMPRCLVTEGPQEVHHLIVLLALFVIGIRICVYYLRMATVVTYTKKRQIL